MAICLLQTWQGLLMCTVHLGSKDSTFSGYLLSCFPGHHTLPGPFHPFPCHCKGPCALGSIVRDLPFPPKEIAQPVLITHPPPSPQSAHLFCSNLTATNCSCSSSSFIHSEVRQEHSCLPLGEASLPPPSPGLTSQHHLGHCRCLQPFNPHLQTFMKFLPLTRHLHPSFR